MTIGEILKHKDIYTYNKLMNMFKIKEPKKTKYIMSVDMDSIEESKKYPPREIELGDSIGNLMKTDSYKREGRRVKQRGWR